MTRTTAPQKKKRRGSYFSCETCGGEFYLSPSYIRKSEKAGTRIRFCKMACYRKDGDKNPFWGKRHSKASIDEMASNPNRVRFQRGEGNPNFLRYSTEYGFKGSRIRWWREHLISTVGKCERCGYSDARALDLHHVDRDRKNNVRENLELLCKNCHAIEHHDAGDGPYDGKKREAALEKRKADKT